jgi:2,3,4,5-tetrahydropyridine-2,6-dicarboxylate N-succinyltransferase
MTIITRMGHRYRDTASGKTLDVWYPRNGERIARHCPAEKLGLIEGDFVTVTMSPPEVSPASTEEVYLRLHLLSELAFQPNTLNLERAFSLLNNVAWTSAGPVLPGRVLELRARLQGEAHHLQVSSIDKFPRMTDYVIPEGVRIADADRVRLGAHLSPGTTVMHEGFVNFNAGTLGESMVEGRVTPGVIVGRNSDQSRPSWAVRVMSGLPLVATVEARIPVRQLRANIRNERSRQLRRPENTTPPERKIFARRRWHFRGRLSEMPAIQTCQGFMTHV